MSLDVTLTAVRPVAVFTQNITHNLAPMAEAAGIYQALWRPEEIGAEYASDLIPLLETGVAKLLDAPDVFRALNPSNGWGTYGSFLDFVIRYLEACRENPDAKVHACR